MNPTDALPQLDEPTGVGPALGLDDVISGTARLLELLAASPASRLSVSLGSVRWEIETAAPVAATVVAAPAGAPPTAGPTPAAETAPVDTGHPILAPLVGVFYVAPRPGAAPFVQVGDRVEAGQHLAVVEAMKMMNEIVADRSGVVREVHARNEAIVEFGERLFTLEPV